MRTSTLTTQVTDGRPLHLNTEFLDHAISLLLTKTQNITTEFCHI